MNIKSFLLGSAAALVAVSGARAADAVTMVEAEPMEYVRVCDVYGTGFFYIPGTETCLKIDGYVRMRIQANDASRNSDLDLGNLNDVVAPGDVRGIGSDDYSVSTRVRARLNFDAREETELGMLRAYARVQSTNNGITDSLSAGQNILSSYVMDAAYLQLGGLTVGKLDSLWAERDGLFTDNDWSLGDFNNNRISYTFAVAGLTAAISAEDDGSGDFAPDVVGQLAYKDGWGEAYISGVYDEQAGTNIVDSGVLNAATGRSIFYSNGSLTRNLAFNDPLTAAQTFALQSVTTGNINDDDGAFALKGGVTLKDLIAPGSQLKIEGSYAFDPTVYATNKYITGQYNGTTFGTDIVSGGVAFNGPAVTGFTNGFGTAGFNLSTEWQIGAGYQQKFEKLFAAVSGIYGETFDLEAVTAVSPTGVITTRNFGNAEFYGGAVNVGYNLTSNFSVLGEVSYREVKMPNGFNDFDETGGFLEFKRTF
jgi:hypothetical protein